MGPASCGQKDPSEFKKIPISPNKIKMTQFPCDSRLCFYVFDFSKIMDIYFDYDTMKSGFDDRARYICKIIPFKKQHNYIHCVLRRIFLNSSEDLLTRNR